MSELWTWLLGLGIIGYVISIWYRQKQHQDNTSQFFNKTLDKQINERDQAIKDIAEKQAKTLEEYYAKKAKFHNNLLRDPNRNTPDEGSES
jgi:hypothetical protein